MQGIIRSWQDFDENIRSTRASDYGKWWACRSVDGHVQQIAGPCDTEEEAREKVGGLTVLGISVIVKE